MAVELGKKGKGISPTLNVTPLVDVVLVLLIIFMVVTPLLTKRLWTKVPAKAEPSAAAMPDTPPLPPLLLKLFADGSVRLGDAPVSREALEPALREALAPRPEPLVFFDAEDGVPYGEAVRLMDQVHALRDITLVVLPEKAP